LRAVEGSGLRDGLMVLMLKVGLIWKFTALLQVVELDVALWRELCWSGSFPEVPHAYLIDAQRVLPASRPLRSIVGNQFASASNLFIHGFISNYELPERRIRYKFDRKPIPRFPYSSTCQFVS
jgi:hypothetical protein